MKRINLILLLLFISCIRLKPSPLDTSKSNVALLVNIALAYGLTGGGGSSVSPYIGELKPVPEGTFQRDTNPANTSKITAFRMSATEITQSQFTTVTGLPNPSRFNTVVNGPVDNTNWYYAITFCNLLSMKEGLTPVYTVNGNTDPDAWDGTVNGTIVVPTASNAVWNTATANMSANGYRLPTEMEFLWAAMGATNNIAKPFAGSNGSNAVNDYAWNGNNSGGTTHTVATKLPNELGLYDMTGNAWEWIHDWYAALPTGPLVDYSGPAAGTGKVRTGYSYNNPLTSTGTIVFRGLPPPERQSDSSGFRVVRRL